MLIGTTQLGHRLKERGGSTIEEPNIRLAAVEMTDRMERKVKVVKALFHRRAPWGLNQSSNNSPF